MHVGKVPVLALVAGGILGTLGFGGLLLSITAKSTRGTPVDSGVHLVVPDVARDGIETATAIPTETPTPTQAPSATPTATATPSPASLLAGLQVWAGGDSVAAFMTEAFVSDMVAAGAKDDCVANASGNGFVDNSCDFWKISTGLSRPDYFDWMAKLQQVVATSNPDVMVFMVGGNDAQTLLNADGSGTGLSPFTAAWDTAYAQRVSQAMDIMTAEGRYAAWVGMPIMLDANEYSGYNANIQKLNAIYAAQAALHPRVAYVDAYSLFSDASGNWAQYLPDIHGVVQQMRTSEGVHLTTLGGEFLAQHVIQALIALMQS